MKNASRASAYNSRSKSSARFVGFDSVLSKFTISIPAHSKTQKHIYLWHLLAFLVYLVLKWSIKVCVNLHIPHLKIGFCEDHLPTSFLRGSKGTKVFARIESKTLFCEFGGITTLCEFALAELFFEHHFILLPLRVLILFGQVCQKVTSTLLNPYRYSSKVFRAQY